MGEVGVRDRLDVAIDTRARTRFGVRGRRQELLQRFFEGKAMDSGLLLCCLMS